MPLTQETIDVMNSLGLQDRENVPVPEYDPSTAIVSAPESEGVVSQTMIKRSNAAQKSLSLDGFGAALDNSILGRAMGTEGEIIDNINGVDASTPDPEFKIGDQPEINEKNPDGSFKYHIMNFEGATNRRQFEYRMERIARERHNRELAEGLPMWANMAADIIGSPSSYIIPGAAFGAGAKMGMGGAVGVGAAAGVAGVMVDKSISNAVSPGFEHDTELTDFALPVALGSVFGAVSRRAHQRGEAIGIKNENAVKPVTPPEIADIPEGVANAFTKKSDDHVPGSENYIYSRVGPDGVKRVEVIAGDGKPGADGNLKVRDLSDYTPEQARVHVQNEAVKNGHMSLDELEAHVRKTQQYALDAAPESPVWHASWAAQVDEDLAKAMRRAGADTTGIATVGLEAHGMSAAEHARYVERMHEYVKTARDASPVEHVAAADLIAQDTKAVKELPISDLRDTARRISEIAAEAAGNGKLPC